MHRLQRLGLERATWPNRSGEDEIGGELAPRAYDRAMPEVHLYIEIDDLERGIEFYVKGLGLTLKRRLTERWVELAGAQMPIHLLARPEPEFESGDHVLRKDFSRHWTPIHLDFVVEDLDAAVDRAVRRERPSSAASTTPASGGSRRSRTRSATASI